MIIVKHSAFKDVKINYPINWCIDPYKNKSWVLNFMSLRWLSGFSDKFILEVLEDFYDFHYINNKKNLYLTTLRGDHAAAIRMKFFCKLLHSNNLQLKDIANKLLEKDFLNACGDRMYRAGHNHGLMLDNAMLEAYLNKNREFNIDYDQIYLILLRGEKTSDKMYFPNGITKEHSISYQEYNLPIVIEFFELYSSIVVEGGAFLEKLNSIKFSSLMILSIFLNSKNNYFSIGDTLRTFKPRLLKQVYGDENAILNFSREIQNAYFCTNGFFALKKNIGNSLLHFVSTCQWNSFNHKQNDEFSFCLEYKGITIFDELGYSAFFKSDDISLIYSEQGHSTFYYENDEWLDRDNVVTKSKVVDYNVSDDGFELGMEHFRSKTGLKFERKFVMFQKCIKITDKISVENNCDDRVIHRFILNPSLMCKIVKNSVSILLGDVLIATIEMINLINGEWVLDSLPFANEDSRIIENTKSLSFINSNGINKVDFLITLF